MKTAHRTTEHQRNHNLEDLLGHLNADLGQIGDAALTADTKPTLPTVFLVGCARSGTSLALQWLSSLGQFSWPTNFISRFYAAPWVGERVQQMLTNPDYDFRGELTLDRPSDPDPFVSHLGKTHGLLAPNEFWYWWRRFLPEAASSHYLSDDQLAQIDSPRLCAELAAWQAVTHKPLAMKALIMNWNLPWLAEAVPGSVFIHITRDRFMNTQSLLEARRDFHGTAETWYSFRPPQYDQLKDLAPVEQVAGQIHHTESAVTAGLARIAPERQLTLAYEDLCANPLQVYEEIRKMMATQGCPLPASYEGPESFAANGQIRLDEADQAAVHRAWQAYR
ncbi:MAG: hypothetical protein ACI9UQ_000614 [Candidatus Krumholzibacteriia bacterium]